MVCYYDLRTGGFSDCGVALWFVLQSGTAIGCSGGQYFMPSKEEKEDMDPDVQYIVFECLLYNLRIF